MLGTNEADYGLRPAVAEENLALAVNDMLLKIHCNQFGGAEVFHSLRNLEAQLFSQLEICIDGVTGRKNYCRIVLEVDA